MSHFIPKLKRLDLKNQTSCGPPTQKDGVCFGPYALTPGFMESRNRRVFIDQIPSINTFETLLSVSSSIIKMHAFIT